ncbi:UPF0758 domain-containing protein, partial [Burkholderia multivorans]
MLISCPLPPVECRDAHDAPPAPPERAQPDAPRRRRPGNWRPNLPRERLLERGPAALTDDELVALLLGSGVRGHSVFASARALLVRFGSLRGLLDATPADFGACPGIGPARAA